jgi:hypothetical protein
MWFRSWSGGEPQRWLGVEPVASRFAGKRRVRVLCEPGPAFVADVQGDKFQVIDFDGGK